jgi:hypothetical protein
MVAKTLIQSYMIYHLISITYNYLPLVTAICYYSFFYKYVVINQLACSRLIIRLWDEWCFSAVMKTIHLAIREGKLNST